MEGSTSRGTGAVTPRRSPPAPPSRLTRVRCTHCAMPVAPSLTTCWSCGLEPTAVNRADERRPAAAVGPGRARTSRRAQVGGAVVALVVVVVLAWLTLFAAADGGGVRGLSDRLRGDGAEAPAPRGASAPPPMGP